MRLGEKFLPNVYLFKRGVLLSKRPYLFPILLLVLTSCTVSLPSGISPPFRLIENVPFFPQEDFQCGPASLAGVMNYWGVNVSLEEIAREIYSPSAKGTLNLDMILYAKRKGMESTYYQGSMEDIKNKIDSGHPLIVMVDLGLWIYQQNHFMVVIGYDQNGIVVNSGRERLKYLPLRNFMKKWEKTQFWTLWITPSP